MEYNELFIILRYSFSKLKNIKRVNIRIQNTMLIESKRTSQELCHIVWVTKVFQTTHLCYQNKINQNRVHLKQVRLISLI